MDEVTTPTLLKKSAYAAHRGVSPGMVTHWIKGDRLVLVDGMVDVVKSDAALAATMDPARGGKGGRSERATTAGKEPIASTPSAGFQQNRARREAANAGEAELRLLERARDLVLRRDYDRAVTDSTGPVTAALDSLAPRIARAVVGETDVRKIEAAIEAEIAAIRAEAVKGLKTLLSEPDQVRQ